MPELPEVETIRRGIEREFLGLALCEIQIYERLHLLQNCSAIALQRQLIGQVLRAVGRRGKYLIFDFGPHSLLLHLRMSGRLLLQPMEHTRLILTFSTQKKLYFDDARRFGTLHLFRSKDLAQLQPIKELGLEPLSLSDSAKAFRQQLRTKQEIKRLLLDQRKIAGLGNIYANEALFRAGIHPQRAARSLTASERRRLFEAIPAVLQRALSVGGSSIDSYRTPQGELGRFQNEFSVYGRDGEPCPRCRMPIAHITQGGRSSYYCPHCQPIRPIAGLKKSTGGER